MSIPTRTSDQREEQDAHQIQEPPDIQPSDATRFAPMLPVSPSVVQRPREESPYYVQEENDDDPLEQHSGGMGESFAPPFQASSDMPVLNGDQHGVDQLISPPANERSARTKTSRLSLLRIVLPFALALLVLGVLWVTVFAQPAQPLTTTKSATTTGTRQSPGGQAGTTVHTGPTAPPILKPTTVTVPPSSTTGSTLNGSWVPQHLPAGWANAGLTTGDGIFAERTAMTFTDREVGLDFRNVGTRGQHAGTFTASTFILTPGGRARFAQNDVRVVNNVLFDKVAAIQLVQSAINDTPSLLQFQVQGQQEFAWVDVAYTLFQSKIDTNATLQQRTEGLETDPATGQPRVHHMSVLLVRVTPGTQGANAPMGGSGWLVSDYGIDLPTPLTIAPPV